MTSRFTEAMETLPLVAILRGVRPDEVVAIGQVLHACGFRLIEVPLNSPEPLESIGRLRQALPPEALVGAGTVLTPEAAQSVAAAHGDLVVMPNADVTVIKAAKDAGRVCLPGVATPTEAFAALAAGADALKAFPAEAISPAVIKAWRAVLPQGTAILPVGGITPQTMAPYLEAGVAGFGLGSALYKPGMSAEDVRRTGQAFADSWKRLTASR